MLPSHDLQLEVAELEIRLNDMAAEIETRSADPTIPMSKPASKSARRFGLNCIKSSEK